MDDIPLPALFGLLLVLLACSAFFSGSETGLMTLNRYRIKTRAQKGERGAKLAHSLLQRPDRLIGTILLGNNFINTLAASVATIIGLRIFPGDTGIAVATAATTLLLLIFAEVTPKTLAALHPERIGVPAAYVLWPLLRLIYPLVWAVNLISNGLLRLIGVTPEDAAQHSLSTEELRTVVAEAGAMIPQRHQKMLLSILDLEKATVEDIMVPRNEIIGIDISEPWETLLESVISSQHTRLPLFDGSIDNLKGVVHLRRVVGLVSEGKLDVSELQGLAREPYFVPEGTPLNQQLLNFQNQKRRIGFVVDEYGDIQGLVTLEDILEEVIGEFTSDPATRIKNVYADPDGSYRVTGSVTIRSLNKNLSWKLPTNGPKTINGLLLEKLESLPQPGAKVAIGGYQFEITEMRANAIKGTRIWPPAAANLLGKAAKAARA
ncbi:HlyC/CorC family transporter [Sinimarinibacterium sp. CAU 1509]|uniref:HlyC/CorC family transporter n=1 Tax=Sinimarinibacterium sp. CAU 1509 TaxID=2562283 RepID=UPI0010ACAAAB|nr:HlyC/CorC family transporter [Sinimarinibacterium sp. CAU 1509]TJY62113.1 HlyC/CorC family transporter [Sinimarinibacterium sp. CAU 1509]